jgi:outer membrane lipopolysaccharide assembly protein LptE/RlpB
LIKNIRAALHLMIIAGFLFSACGYKFTGGGDLPSSVKKISVSVLENRTAESGIENIITNDIIYEITRNGKIVENKDNADASLTGTIESVSDDAIAHRGDKISLERRVTVVLNLNLTGKDGKKIWAAKGIASDQAFSILSDKIATENEKRKAITTLSKRLAEKVYSRLTDNF